MSRADTASMRPEWRERTRSAASKVTQTSAWNLVGFMLGVLLSVLTARALGPAGRGAMAVLASFVSIAALLCGLGTNVSIRVFWPRGLVRLRVFWRLSAYLSASIPIVSTAFCLAYGAFVDPAVRDLAVVVAAAIMMLGVFVDNQMTDTLNAAGQTSVAAALRVLGVTVTVLAFVPGLFMSLDLIWAVYAYTAGYIVRNLAAVYFVRRIERTEAQVDGIGAGVLVREGVKLLGLNAGQALTYRCDQFVVGGALGSSSLGVYAVASAPINVVEVISNSMAQVVMHGVAAGRMGRKDCILWTAVATGQTVIIGGLVWVLAPYLVPMIFGAEYLESVTPMRLLMVAEVCLAPYLVLSRAAAGKGLTTVAGLSGILGLFAMTALLLLLVPAYGLVGAAVANAVAYLFMSVFVGVAVLKATATKGGLA